jgi:hypothetical protein
VAAAVLVSAIDVNVEIIGADEGAGSDPNAASPS